MTINFEKYRTVVFCEYRGEKYNVRDNGAVFRQVRPNMRKRPLDETWTFGNPCKSKGYMNVSDHTVHRIVATAFLGEQPSPSHVVDHIDTNRRNNRRENLRWVTKLENILLNPISAKRVTHLYGSIEEFLADPSNPKNGTLDQNFEWMRTVSRAEADYSRNRLLTWAASDKPSSGGTLDDWIFGSKPGHDEKETESLIASKTPNAVQRNWKVPSEFPACPCSIQDMALITYHGKLKMNAIFSNTPFGQSKVSKFTLTSDGTELLVLGDHGEGAIKQWSLAKVTLERGAFVHESCGTFFTLEGAEKEFTLAQGLLWEGGETLDDLC
jgi:hypothetical protein